MDFNRYIKVIDNKRIGMANAVALFCDVMSGAIVGKSVLEVDI
ncbi:hypothetical protein [Aquisediminimonas sediminicola]|nr:hypothetical protein [Aquisediminimonas sediminicola]